MPPSKPPKNKTWVCAIYRRDNKSEFKVPNTVRGLVALIDHWKLEHPGRVTTSNGTPVEEMSMEWAK